MLNKIPSTDNAENNAIIKAQEYGISKGVTGRLIKYEEANAIINRTDDNMKKILWGKWTDGTQPTQGCLYRWIGNVNCDIAYIWYVHGYDENLSSNNYYSQHSIDRGVRPVLVVPES